jgi:uncharacterized protein
MKKLLLVTFWMAIILLAQVAGAQEPEKYADNQIEELSKKLFCFAIVDGKQLLKVIPEPDKRSYAETFEDSCGNTIFRLGRPGAAISVPGTSVILAFLECPAGRGFAYDAVVAFFDRKDLNVPLCFSYLDLMADSSSYYYGAIRSMEAFDAGDNALHVAVTMSGPEGADYWTSLAFLRIDMNCGIDVLSRFDSSYSTIGGQDEGVGTEIEYRFIDNKTIEVDTRHMAFTEEGGEEIVKTERKRYDLAELRTDFRSRVFPSSTEKAAAILNSGIDVNLKDKDGTTPLMWATVEGWPEVVKALLSKGAKIDVQDNRGWTALRWAVEKGWPKVIRVLLERGADVNVTAKDGSTAWTVASERGHHQIMELLKARGAKE